MRAEAKKKDTALTIAMVILAIIITAFPIIEAIQNGLK